MITSSLLKKIRCINKILQEAAGQHISFKDIAGVLKNVIHASVYIADLQGSIKGYALVDNFKCKIMINLVQKERFPEGYNKYLLKSNELKINLQQKPKDCIFLEGQSCPYTDKIVAEIPIIGGGKRLGTVILVRFDGLFGVEDVILAENGAAITGMEMLRLKVEETEKEMRYKEVLRLALDTLSCSEREAVEHVFEKLGNNEGILVTRKLGIAGSVIANALRKLECAGVIESRSLGGKGTYLKVLNPYLFEFLTKKIVWNSGLRVSDFYSGVGFLPLNIQS